MTSDARYLWTLPMFHCNGWCFTWGVTAVGATHAIAAVTWSQRMMRWSQSPA